MTVPAGIIFPWPDTVASIPAGFSRVAALDDVFLRGAASVGGTGSGSHSHTVADHLHAVLANQQHTGTGGNAETVSLNNGATSGFSANHTHGFTLAGATESTANSAGASLVATVTFPPYLTVIWIESLGTADLPAGIMSLIDAAVAPTDWAFMNGTDASPDARLRGLRGAATGNDGGGLVAGGDHIHSSAHTHNWSHTHAAPANSAATTPGNINTDTSPATIPSMTVASHAHPMTGVTAANALDTIGPNADSSTPALNTPPSIFLLPIRAAAGAQPEAGIIAAWMGDAGDIPAFWEAATELNDTNLFPHCLSNPATSGDALGNADHTHTAFNHGHNGQAHTHGAGSIAMSDFDGSSLSADTGVSARTDDPHLHSAVGTVVNSNTHAVGTTNPSMGNGSNLPPYADVIWIRSTGVPPPPVSAGADGAAIAAIRHRRNVA